MKEFKKAGLFFSEKRYEDAIKQYERVKEDDGLYVAARYNIGTCMIKLRRYEEAISVFNSVLEVNTRHQKSIFNLGYCYLRQNNYKKALTQFNRAWALDNDDTDCEKAINIILKSYTRGWDK